MICRICNKASKEKSIILTLTARRNIYDENDKLGLTKIPFTSQIIDVNFCPTCGKKLNEELLSNIKRLEPF